MISRIAEWYRIVNPQPTSTTIDKRTAAVKNLIATFDESDDIDFALSWIAGAIGGLETGFAHDSEVIKTLVSAIKSEDSAFPQDLTDNALELRVAAATAIGEIIVRNPDNVPDETAILLSLSVESGLGLRPRPGERYIAAMLAELQLAANKLLANAQEIRRKPVNLVKSNFLTDDEVSDPLVALNAVRATLKEFAHQSAIDREELDVLWWLFSGSSKTNEQFSEMEPSVAPFVIGVEVADICILPPANNASMFVLRALEHVKKTTPKQFDKVIASSTESARSNLIGSMNAKDLGSSQPVLFPLTWLCCRLSESGGKTDWKSEFQNMTKIPASQEKSVADIALQAFRERVVQRQYMSLFAE